MMHPIPSCRPSSKNLLVTDFLQSEIEMKLKWEKHLNQIYKNKIAEYEKKLNLKKKKSF